MTESDITPDCDSPTFVHDGIEVYQTGRVAEQQVTKTKRKILDKKGLKPDQMVEIKPVDETMAPFKAKWVKEDSLYKVGQNPQNSSEIELMER